MKEVNMKGAETNMNKMCSEGVICVDGAFKRRLLGLWAIGSSDGFCVTSWFSQLAPNKMP